MARKQPSFYWLLPTIFMILLAWGLFVAGLAVRIVVSLLGHPPINEVSDMDYQLPLGSKWAGSTGVDQVQFFRPGHTAALPRLQIHKRRPANGKPTSEYHVMLVHAVADPLGVVRNALIELNVRNVAGQDAATIKTLLGAMGTMCSNADFQDDAVVELLLPAPNAVALS